MTVDEMASKLKELQDAGLGNKRVVLEHEEVTYTPICLSDSSFEDGEDAIFYADYC